MLRDGEGLFLVLPGETGTFTFLVTQDSLDWHRSNLSAGDLEEIVDFIRVSMGVGGLRPDSRDIRVSGLPFPAADAFKLYQELLSPFRSKLDSLGHLYVSASGALTAIPPSILILDEPAPTAGERNGAGLVNVAWLARSHATTVLPAPSSLRDIAGRSRSGADRAFMGVGNACTGWGIEDAPDPPEDICGPPPDDIVLRSSD